MFDPYLESNLVQSLIPPYTSMFNTIPNWIERLLGINAESGEGTAWGIEHAWGWPPWATLLFAAFAVVFVVAIYLREGRRGSRPYRMMLAAIRLGLVAICRC